MARIKDVLVTLEKFAPLPLQEDWDNAGLQIGLTETDVSGVLLCLDVNEDIVREAQREGCNLIVSHHPLLFRGVKCVSDADYVQRTIRMCIKNDISVISMHTNMDNAHGGVNFRMAEKIGLTAVKPLQAVSSDASSVENGGGAIGILPHPMPTAEFLQMLKERFSIQALMTNRCNRKEVRTVAMCGGAGAFMLDEAIRQGADAFLTGEMHYHEYFGHEDEIQIAVMGHYESEQFTQEVFREILAVAYPQMKIVMATTCTNPIVVI